MPTVELFERDGPHLAVFPVEPAAAAKDVAPTGEGIGAARAEK